MFGQLVIGPPGSGKTTYCFGMQQFLNGVERKPVLVNLDPANDELPYECDIDVSELVTVDDVMHSLKLGPNGGLMYCMEYLEQNLDWLETKISAHKDGYFVFDCPGQVELFTHHTSVQRLVEFLTSKLNIRLAAVHLVDAHYCSDASKFISAMTVSLCAMIRLELPHVNVLSKIDLVESMGKLSFRLEYYTEAMDLEYLVDCLPQDTFSTKHRSLSAALCELVEDYGLVSFIPLNIEDKESVYAVLKLVDKANGFVFGASTSGNESIVEAAMSGAPWEDIAKEAHEKYVDSNNDIDEVDFSTL